MNEELQCFETTKTIEKNIHIDDVQLISEKDNILYPIEIKKSAHPTLDMAKHFSVLSKNSEKTVGQGCILCQCNKMLYLSEDIISVPVEFL